MIHRAAVSVVVAIVVIALGLLQPLTSAQAAPGRDENSDQGEGWLIDHYGSICAVDAPIVENGPSASDCGHVNADNWANQEPAGGSE